MVAEERFKLAQQKRKRLRCRQCKGYAFQVSLLYRVEAPDNVIPIAGGRNAGG
jgi:hypothetical protein